MRIPVGQFGQVIAEPQRQASVPMDNPIGGAVASMGKTIAAIADSKIHEQEEMARAKAANTLLDHEIFVKGKTQEISDRIARGELPYRDADKVFREEVSSKRLDEVEGLSSAYRQTLLMGYRRTVSNAQFALGRAVETARRAEFKGQFTESLDKLGKLAGMPGADIEQINSQADLLFPLARQAGIPEDVVRNSIQNLKDRNWTNQATQRAMQAKDNLGGIQQLEHDLTAADGFYAQKLDTDKRNIILRSVINDRLRIENRIQHDIDRRESKAEKVLGEVDRQISSGVPMTPDMVLTWSAKVRGTAFEEDFKQRLKEEDQVQQVLRLPIDQQKAFVQQRESDLMTVGGSSRDKANLARLKGAVESNTKQLQNDPLLFVQNRTGQVIEPINIHSLLEPGGASSLATQLNERVATVRALQKQYGPQVKMHPLLPQEADFLVKALDQATPKQQATLFGTLRSAFNDDDAYTAAMRQIAPDSPVRAQAGAIFAKQRGITLEKNWFGTDSVAASVDVAETMLIGESIVNRSNAQKSDDGNAKSLFVPPRKEFETQFASVAGDLYRGRERAQEADLQAAYAYYVGRAVQTGRLRSTPTDVDNKLVKEALAATVGEPVNFHSRGMVTAPWGMLSDRFKANAANAFQKAVRDSGLPGAVVYQFENYGLMHYRGSTYVPTMGGLPVLHPKTGQPLVLDVGDTPTNPGMKVPQ